MGSLYCEHHGYVSSAEAGEWERDVRSKEKEKRSPWTRGTTHRLWGVWQILPDVDEVIVDVFVDWLLLDGGINFICRTVDVFHFAVNMTRETSVWMRQNRQMSKLQGLKFLSFKKKKNNTKFNSFCFTSLRVNGLVELVDKIQNILLHLLSVFHMVIANGQTTRFWTSDTRLKRQKQVYKRIKTGVHKQHYN